MDITPDALAGKAQKQERPHTTTTPETEKHDTSVPHRPLPTPYQPSDLCKPSGDDDQVVVNRVDHLGILNSEDLVPIVLSHLSSNHDALAKIVRINKMYYKAGVRYLWQRADTKNLLTYVTSAARRQPLARWMEMIVFFDHEIIWPAQALPCPDFERAKTLELYATTLRCNGAGQLLPFLHRSLQELKIWTNDSVADHVLPTLRDNLWVSRVASICTKLHTLKLEVALDLSSTQLTAFFEAMPQLEVLRLGSQMTSILDDDAVSTILRAPSITNLSMDIVLTSTLMHRIVATGAILPMIEQLEIAFTDGVEDGPAILLGACTNVKTVSMKLGSVSGRRVTTIHPSFFSVVGSLPKLEFLGVYLSPDIHLSITDLEHISAHRAHIHLTASGSQYEYPQLPANVDLTGADLANTPMSPESLATMELLALPTLIECSYDEVTAIIHKVTAVSHNHMHLFDLMVAETTSFGWPSVEDWQALWVSSEPEEGLVEQEDLIWKATSRAFAPDPRNWAPRELDLFFKESGEKLRLEEVASDGSYIHIS